MERITVAIPEMGNDLFRKYMKSKYAASLRRSGAEPVWIDLSAPLEAAEEACRCAGLLLPGGADVDPSLYHQMREPVCGPPCPQRDAAEPVLYREFVKTGKPILAICRGMQLLNVLQNGTLYQDIKTLQSCRHSDFPHRGSTVHAVSLRPDSILYNILSKEHVAVNSMHHQAVQRLGDDLTASAVSEDGFIEGIELVGHPFCLGVQWHPEHLSRKIERQQRIFDAFVRACAESVAGKDTIG